MNEAIKSITAGTLKMLSGVGVGAIMSEACKAFTPDDINKAKKVCIDMGSAMLGAAVIMRTDAYVDQLVDEVWDLGAAVKELVKRPKKEMDVETVIVEEAAEPEEVTE